MCLAIKYYRLLLDLPPKKSTMHKPHKLPKLFYFGMHRLPRLFIIDYFNFFTQGYLGHKIKKQNHGHILKSRIAKFSSHYFP
jgi:hypothetical protein